MAEARLDDELVAFELLRIGSHSVRHKKITPCGIAPFESIVSMI